MYPRIILIIILGLKREKKGEIIFPTGFAQLLSRLIVFMFARPSNAASDYYFLPSDCFSSTFGWVLDRLALCLLHVFIGFKIMTGL